MWRLFNRGLLRLHRMIFAFGLRAIPMFWKLYVGRAGKVVNVSLPDGHRLFVRKRTSDAMIFRQIFLDRESDFMVFPQNVAVRDKYQNILAHGRKPLIIDCGANTGASSIFFALLFPKALVLALEPSDDSSEILSRNAGLYESIIPVRAGIWDKQTHLKIVNRTAKPFAYQTSECAEGDEPGAVAGLTVPGLLQEFPDSEPLLIKIDIEGAEKALFRSNTSWVEGMPLLILEPHDWMLPQRRSSADFFSVVARMRCDILIRGENLFVFNWAALGNVDREQKDQ